MSNDVGESDGDQQSEQYGVDLRHLAAGAVQEDSQETNGDVEDLAGDLMAVNLAILARRLRL